MMSAAAIAAKYGARSGERVGHLTFLRVSGARADRARLLGAFACDCGAEVTLHLSRTLNGHSRTHCGCKTDRGSNRTHGMHGSAEYRSWMSMKARCLDPGNKDFPRWGGRGVTVAPEWQTSFAAFYAHIGPRPAGTSLDRIDNRQGYEPGNVRWATPAVQQTNRRSTWMIEIDGQTYEGAEAAARAFGVSSMTIQRWCAGYADQRRTHQSNSGRHPPRPNCRRWRKYAA